MKAREKSSQEVPYIVHGFIGPWFCYWIERVGRSLYFVNQVVYRLDHLCVCVDLFDFFALVWCFLRSSTLVGIYLLTSILNTGLCAVL